MEHSQAPPCSPGPWQVLWHDGIIGEIIKFLGGKPRPAATY